VKSTIPRELLSASWTGVRPFFKGRFGQHHVQDIVRMLLKADELLQPERLADIRPTREP